ncbi:helix-turn-helix domain-containing protein [Lysinibacillus sp. 54212]|uniref:helix-turn-helix domain-containing protein n=1 Tax=Lysinibacillus sp. 54212 TaxID=3119829 RepID=UPI002FC81435
MNFGKRVKEYRLKKDFTLKQLAEKSGISASMLSQIERDEKNPTLQVACQIAEGLNTTLSTLLEERKKEEVIVTRKEERLIYIDEKSMFQRHLLSPSFSMNEIEFLLNIMPANGQSSVFPPHKPGVTETVYVAKGKLQLTLGDGDFQEVLEEGDSVYYSADTTHHFKNLLDSPCEYYVIIDSSKSSK